MSKYPTWLVAVVFALVATTGLAIAGDDTPPPSRPSNSRA